MATNNAINLSQAGVTYYNGAGLFTGAAPGAAGIPLISAGAGVTPTFGTAVVGGGGTGLTTVTVHNLLVGNGTSNLNLIAPTSGLFPLVSTGTGSDPTFSLLTVPGGGTGLGTLTAFSVLIGNGTGNIQFAAPGAAGIPLVSTGAASNPAFGTALVAGGGTGVTSLTGNGVLRMNAAGTQVQSVALTDGQLLIGATGAPPIAASLTAGSGISITPGANSITISTIATAFTWIAQGTSTTMTVNTGYLTTGATLVTLTLPATAAQFTQLAVAGQGAGGWAIAQAAGQQIIFGSSATTAGAGGSLASTDIHDVVYLLCTVANTTWTVVNSVGNINVV